MLREALAEWLRNGNQPSRVDVGGDERGDPETRYEFRFEFAGVRVYLYLVVCMDDPADPQVTIRKVARWN